MPSSTAREPERPQPAETPAEEIVLSLPDNEWAAVQQVADAIFGKPHAGEVHPTGNTGASLAPDLAERLEIFNGWVDEAHKAEMVDDRPAGKESAGEDDHEVQVEAAQLKMILDRRLNRKTVQWISDLAKG